MKPAKKNLASSFLVLKSTWEVEKCEFLIDFIEY